MVESLFQCVCLGAHDPVNIPVCVHVFLTSKEQDMMDEPRSVLKPLSNEVAGHS